jgi:hypothetical protein
LTKKTEGRKSRDTVPLIQPSSIVGAQDSIGTLCANYRKQLVSGAERSHSERAVGTPDGAQDTNQSSEDTKIPE